MYTCDERDSVVELPGIPQSSVGAPIPHLVADESRCVVAFYVEDETNGWDGTSVREVGPDSQGEAFCLVRFNRVSAHMFGPPNDEAFSGHPLASRGLTPYGTFEVRNSSWLRTLERMLNHSLSFEA